MSHRYSGLSAQQVLSNRRKYGANVITPPARKTVWQKVEQISTYWLIQFLMIAEFAVLFLLLILDICLDDLSCEAGWILVVIAAEILLVYFIAFLGGRWNENKQKHEVDPLISILLMALAFSGCIAYYQSVFIGEDGIEPFLEPIGIIVAILLATGVTYILEKKNEKIFRALNDVNDEELVKVVRDGDVTQVPRRDIVVGDIILLETGDEIPADAELLESLNLVVNESSLTGELECTKSANISDFDLEATFPTNHVMKGCTIIEGEAIAQVFAVGDRTVSGETYVVASVNNVENTPLQNQLNRLAKTITMISYAVAILIVLGRLSMYFIEGNAVLNTTTGWVNFVKYLLDTVMIAVTLLVVTVPEGLPMAVTLCLAFSMRRLMRQNTLPRTMHACETMGATTIICTDKTGTLTQNQMCVQAALCIGHEVNNENNYFTNRLWEGIALNTTANLNLNTQPQVIGNPTEGALLLWMKSHNQSYTAYRTEAEIIERLPFSTERKYMATLVKSNDGKKILYVKGAPDVLLRYCKTTSQEHITYINQLADYQNHAYRTLGLAYRVMQDGEDAWRDGILCVDDITMLGVVAIADPIREDVPQAIRNCMRAGIRVMIITGDALGTAREIARQLGLWSNMDNKDVILQGSELEFLTDDELTSRLQQVKIVSRARPNDKERIVRLLRQMGHVVAVTGDGTNDAPALNAANIGLSMGDGTAVAREASDMTIMDNSFTTISNAVIWGRSLYKNIQRFILFQLTVNMVACLIVTIGAFIGTDSPLTIMQMLWVNLILDTFAALALASLPPSARTLRDKPRSINEPILHGLEKRILGVGTIMTVGLLGLLILFIHMDITSLVPMKWQWSESNHLSAYELGLFFTIFVMLQYWNLFNARAFMTQYSALCGLSWQRTPWFIVITVIILIGQILIVELPGLQGMFSVARGGLLWSDWLLIVVGTSFVLWIGEIRRFWINKKMKFEK